MIKPNIILLASVLALASLTGCATQTKYVADNDLKQTPSEHSVSEHRMVTQETYQVNVGTHPPLDLFRMTQLMHQAYKAGCYDAQCMEAFIKNMESKEVPVKSPEIPAYNKPLSSYSLTPSVPGETFKIPALPKPQLEPILITPSDRPEFKTMSSPQ